MRLWSLRPSLLDRQGLLACWREAVMAQNALRQGKSHGYYNHPQLQRFKTVPHLIDTYLHGLHAEALQRGYKFNPRYIQHAIVENAISVTDHQLLYEWEHLLRKVHVRSREWYREICMREPKAHPLFCTKAGKIENWEKINAI